MNLPIYHITTSERWTRCQSVGKYTPVEFEDDGFIHCSYRSQLLKVAENLYKGRDDLVVLFIDESRVTEKIVGENLEGGTELYPHVYGPLSLSSVIRVESLRCKADGGFDLPESISNF